MSRHDYLYTQLYKEIPDDRILLLYETLHAGIDSLSEPIHRISKCELGYWELRDMLMELIHAKHTRAVAIPKTEDEATMMVLLGVDYLNTHAPHRLTPDARSVPLKCLSDDCPNDAANRSNYCTTHGKKEK